MPKSRRLIFILPVLTALGAALISGLLLRAVYLARGESIACVIGVPQESDRIYSRGLGCSIVAPKNWKIVDIQEKLKIYCREPLGQGISISIESYGDDFDGWKKALEQEHVPMKYKVSTLKFAPDRIGGYDCISAKGTSDKIPENFLDTSWHNLMSYWLVQHHSRTYLVVCDLHGPSKPDTDQMEQMKAYVETLRFD